MKSSGSAMSSMGSTGAGASALTSLTRTTAKDDTAPISRGSRGQEVAGSSGKKARFADLLGDELSAANDALPPSDAAPATAEKESDHEADEKNEPDARALTLAPPLPAPQDAPFGTPFPWPTEPLVEVKRSVLPTVDGSAAEAKAKVATGDTNAVEDADHEGDTSKWVGPALPETSAAKSAGTPAPVRTSTNDSVTDAQPVETLEPAGPAAIPIPAQMTPTATPVAPGVTTPSVARKTAPRRLPRPRPRREPLPSPLPVPVPVPRPVPLSVPLPLPVPVPLP